LEFGGYFGPMLAAILSFANLVVLVVAAYASSLLPKAFEEKRLRADRIKTTLDISRILYDREFYLYVSAPTWEIAVKWLYWEGQDGDEYRRVVSGTKFLYEETSKKFKLPVEVNSRPYQNLIRFEPHTMPYGYTESATTISELSEHQVFNIWIQFWCRLQALLEEELVDEHLVRRLFADLYRAWLNFMLELPFVGEELEKEISCFSQIDEIEKVLSVGAIWRGWARSACGNIAEGIPWIERGIKDYHQVIRVTLDVPGLLALKAEALYLADRTSEALEAINEAKAMAERFEQRVSFAELHWLRGVFLANIEEEKIM
jgi:hypothetical protein